ncbi:MAG: hypothetical protein JWM37_340 [Candidatus Saccharibacteria bacterium]|nr:hypothetical protein [Candidatus Saccharibacteria bacterium]
MAKQRILVVGGGFGGVKAALELSRSSKVAVTLLSDRSVFRYYPTSYHTATGGAHSNAALSLDALFGDTDVRIVKGTATTIDRKAKSVITEDKQVLFYDQLVLGLGVVTNYFGIEGLQEYSYGVKSLDDIDELKRHLHDQIEDERQPDLNYVIIGAGPTGIELAGSLPGYLKEIMANHGVRRRAIHIDLIEAAPRLLPRMPKDTSRAVKRRLKRLGVKLYVGQAVQGQTADALMVNGKPISSHTVIWTAGVTNHPFFKANNFVMMGRGKVATDIFLQAEDNIFVIGDNANTPFSGMAQTALYDGKFVAENILRALDGKDMRGYQPKRPVSVIPAGPQWAAVNYGKLRIYGKLGWLLREAGDIAGYADYQPWWKVPGQWFTEFEEDHLCKICAAANA